MIPSKLKMSSGDYFFSEFELTLSESYTIIYINLRIIGLSSNNKIAYYTVLFANQTCVLWNGVNYDTETKDIR